MKNEANKIAKSRWDWLDTLRGVAIICVIIGHVIGGVDEQNIVRKVIYTFHMPLMFVISGYCIKEISSIVNVKKYIVKNILALYLPYLIFGFLFWAVKYFIFMGNGEVTLNDGINLFWNYAAWVPGWYLLALLFIKIIDMLFQVLNVDIKMELAFFIILVIISPYVSIYLVNDICNFGIYFIIGRIIRIENEKIMENKQMLLAISILGIVVATLLYYINNEHYGKLFMGCSVSLFCFITFQQISIKSGVVRTLGRDSMVPYVLHAYFTIPVRVILGHFGLLNVVSYTILGTVSGILCSYIIIWLMNNIDAFNKLRYVFYPSKIWKL